MKKIQTTRGAVSTIIKDDLAKNMVLVSDSDGKVAASGAVSTAELNNLNGVTSNIQTQLNKRIGLPNYSSALSVTFTDYIVDGAIVSKQYTAEADGFICGELELATTTYAYALTVGVNNQRVFKLQETSCGTCFFPVSQGDVVTISYNPFSGGTFESTFKSAFFRLILLNS